MPEDIWKNAVSFKERVIHFFKEKKTDDPEFKVYLEVYGRKKLVEIWDEYKNSIKKKEP